MSALGQKQAFALHQSMSALLPKAEDIAATSTRDGANLMGQVCA
jgi:hypothetical protein